MQSQFRTICLSLICFSSFGCGITAGSGASEEKALSCPIVECETTTKFNMSFSSSLPNKIRVTVLETGEDPAGAGVYDECESPTSKILQVTRVGSGIQAVFVGPIPGDLTTSIDFKIESIDCSDTSFASVYYQMDAYPIVFKEEKVENNPCQDVSCPYANTTFDIMN